MQTAEIQIALRHEGLADVSEVEVVGLIDLGELKAKKIGSTYRIKRSAVDAFLDD